MMSSELQNPINDRRSECNWAHLALLYLDLLMSTGIGLIIVIGLDEDKSKQIILQIFLG